MTPVRIACVISAWPTADGTVGWAAWPATATEEQVAAIKGQAWPVDPETARSFADALLRAAADADLFVADCGEAH